YLGIFPAALAFFTWSYALSRIEASRATTFLYLVPVVSVVIAFVWLGETLTGLTLIGGLLALSGVIMVNTLGRKPALSRQPVGLAEQFTARQ
ncbi:MAG: DMT family transporter, partial [Anaerolineae bacterium]|nr:DMT family transporter [Anaerolineae bacterium]